MSVVEVIAREIWTNVVGYEYEITLAPPVLLHILIAFLKT